MDEVEAFGIERTCTYIISIAAIVALLVGFLRYIIQLFPSYEVKIKNCHPEEFKGRLKNNFWHRNYNYETDLNKRNFSKFLVVKSCTQNNNLLSLST